MAVIFSWALLDTLFIWLPILRPRLFLFFFLAVVSLSCSHFPSTEGTQPRTSSLRTTLPVISRAVNISWTLPLPGWNGNNNHTNSSVSQLWFSDSHCSPSHSQHTQVKTLSFFGDLVLNIAQKSMKRLSFSFFGKTPGLYYQYVSVVHRRHRQLMQGKNNEISNYLVEQSSAKLCFGLSQCSCEGVGANCHCYCRFNFLTT